MLKVTKNFIDSDNGMELTKVGSDYPSKNYVPNKNRIELLMDKGFIEEVEEKEDLNDKTVAELKTLATEKELEFKDSILKKDLIALLEK